MNAKIENVARRRFLKLTGISGSALILGSTIPVHQSVWASPSVLDAYDLNVFVSVNTDNTVNIVCHRSEMGQGVRTSIPQIVAEELCVDWQKVVVLQGLANNEYGSQNTDGSRSIRRFYSILREMGASARTMLEQAAADLWKVPVDQVFAESSFVHHRLSQRKVSFGYLAQQASDLSVPDPKGLIYKSKQDFKLIGKGIAGVDLPDMVSGKATFGQDIQFDGMLYASIERAPVVGAKVDSFDEPAAKSVSGVVAVIKMPAQPESVGFHPLDGVAVIATNSWAAMEGRKRLNIKWQHSPHSDHSSQEFIETLKQRVANKGDVVRQNGNAYQKLEQADSHFSATYTVPYLVHAPMEPPAATAWVKKGECEVWACTQTPQSTQANVANTLGIDVKNVKVNVTFLGGGFGRKSKPDFSIEAAILSKQLGKPVKVFWSREDDIQHGYYHAISAQHFSAGITDKGQISGWVQRTAFPSISWTFNNQIDTPQTGELSLGFGDNPLDLQDLSCEVHKAQGHIRIGWMRSVSNIHHAFALGSFVDELATKTAQPTYRLWKSLLGNNRKVDPKKQGFDYQNYGESLDKFPIDSDRLSRVLDEVVMRSGADKPVEENQGWGISVHRSFVTYVAVACKVEVKDGKVKVLEMHNAIDAGTVVNPDRVRSQQEGSMIFGLSLALMSEISVKNGAVEQSNYHDYQVLRMHQSPEIYTYIIDSDAPPGGVGEPGTPPVAASLTNAIFHASGMRIRELPVSKHLQV